MGDIFAVSMKPGLEEGRLRLARSELEPLFGPLGQARNWHRLKERVSKFNRAGKALGVEMSADRDNAGILLAGRNLASLRRFQSRMESGRGHVQRAIGALLAARLSEPAPGQDFAAFSRRQKQQAAANPLHSFLKIGPLMESIFLEPPFRLGPAALPGRTALDAIRANARQGGGKSLVILGQSGIGKSRLLVRAFGGMEGEGGGPRPILPVFLPANRIRLREGSRGIDWGGLPGAAAGLGERLEALFRDGRLTLFLDGLDENPGLLEGDDAAVQAFWATASLNRCFITCRTKYYQQHFLSSPVERIFNGGLAEMNLLEWSPAHVKELYSRIAAGACREGVERSPMRAVEHLARLSPEALGQKLGAIRPTGLTAWAYAIFFASHDGGKFPRDEYEILDYLADLLVRWERGRNPGFPLPDIAHGLLCRLCWHAYQKGNCGQSLGFSAADVLEILRRDYPFLVERQEGLFSALSRMPLLAYDGCGSVFELDRVFGCFFAAKHWVGLGVRGDAEGFRTACQTPLTHEISDFIFQGLDGLDPAARQNFYETAGRSFAAAREAFKSEPDSRHVTAMQAALQPMARVNPEGARAFLQAMVREPRDLPELALLSCARALAYMGDEPAVAAYLKRLRSVPRARETNRGFYLYWLKDGRPTRQGLDWLLGLRVEGWERTCSWLLQELGSAKSAALRAIHLHTFCDLAETFGPVRARADEVRRVARLLERELAAAPPLLRQEFARFRKAARAFGA